MGYFGMFCLGAFVGVFLNLGLGFVETLGDLATVITTIISAAFGGVLFTFIQWMNPNTRRVVYSYPVGLLVSLLWYYSRIALENISSEQTSLQVLGWGHMGALIVVTLLAMAMFVPRAFRELNSDKQQSEGPPTNPALD